MTYLPPFDLIRRFVDTPTVRSELRVILPDNNIVKHISLLIAGIGVDEESYLRTSEDKVQAIRGGIVQSAGQHRTIDGYFIGRLPFPIDVDKRWSMQRYPEFGESARNGIIPSAQVHFDEAAYREDRLPFGP